VVLVPPQLEKPQDALVRSTNRYSALGVQFGAKAYSRPTPAVQPGSVELMNGNAPAAAWTLANAAPAVQACYEVPRDLPHEISTLLMSLNNAESLHCERTAVPYGDATSNVILSIVGSYPGSMIIGEYPFISSGQGNYATQT
jgi:hypothetical protein